MSDVRIDIYGGIKMSKNYEDYKPINPQPPRKRKNKELLFIRYSILFLLILALVISALLFIATHINEKDNNSKTPIIPSIETSDYKNTSDTDAKTDENETENGKIENNVPVFDTSLYKTIGVGKEQINIGDLIFVSSNYKVVYPNDEELVNLANVKSNSYMLSINNMRSHKDIVESMNKMFDDFAKKTGNTDIIIWTAYRDEARQKEVYEEGLKNYGEEASKYVSKPGESDHNTGLGIAINVYRNNKKYSLSEFKEYDWIKDNCYKYGFVERYPNNKIDITGLDYSSSFYLRYVGVPHSEYMKKNDMCLEEYIVKVKEYTLGTSTLKVDTDDGESYEIYYISGDTDDDVIRVPVPLDKEYTISGNNMDGIIVTVKQ